MAADCDSLAAAEHQLREEYGGKAAEYGAEILRYIREQDRNIGRLTLVEEYTGISTSRLMHGMPAIADYFEDELAAAYEDMYGDEFVGVDNLKWGRARKGGFSWNFGFIRSALGE